MLTRASCCDKDYAFYFISFIKENKLKRYSSSGDECAVVHILCISIRYFMISYLWIDKIQGQTLNRLSVSIDLSDQSDPVHPLMTINRHQNLKL